MEGGDFIRMEQGSYCSWVCAVDGGQSNVQSMYSLRKLAKEFCQDAHHTCLRCDGASDIAECEECQSERNLKNCKGEMLCAQCRFEPPDGTDGTVFPCSCQFEHHEYLKLWTRARLNIALVANDCDVAVVAVANVFASLGRETGLCRNVISLIESFVGVYSSSIEEMRDVCSLARPDWRETRAKSMSEPLFDNEAISSCLVETDDDDCIRKTFHITRKDGKPITLNDVWYSFGSSPFGFKWVKFADKTMIQIDMTQFID